MSMEVKEVIEMAERQLREAGLENASIDCRDLYCFLCDIPRSRIILEYQNIMQDNACDQYFALVNRRRRGEPLQYIVGTQDFMGLTFAVDQRVLIPRQDTEVLVEKALDIAQNRIEKKSVEILDLGCGSGAIGVSMAKLYPGAKVTCSDISSDAISVAKDNATISQVSVKFAEGDLFAPFKKKFRNQRFDLVVSNPPYIPSGDIPGLQREIRDHEPVRALDGGRDGLDLYRRIAAEAPEHMNPGGYIALEIGYDQAKAVTALLESEGGYENIQVFTDLAGKDRVVIASVRKLSK